MADYTQLMNLEKKEKGKPASTPPQQSTTRSASQPTGQSVRQSTDQQTSRSVALSDKKTVERPKSFYITTRLDKRLDEAVRYFQEAHGIKKVDRSILVNAMLDNDANWTDEALDVLVERILQLLTDKLIR
jgi:hypothetical protein